MARTYRFSTRITIIFTTIALMSLLIVSLAAMSIARTTLITRTQDFIQTAMENNHREITSIFSSAEKSARAIADEVLLTINIDRFASDKDYQEQYVKSVEGAVQLAAQINSSRSAYVAILGEGNQLKTIWFQDQNRDSIPDIQPSGALIEYLNLNGLIEEIPPESVSYWKVQKSIPNIITVIIPITKGGKVIGYAGSDISYNQLQRDLNNASYLTTGKLWIANSTGLPLITRTTDNSTSIEAIPTGAIKADADGTFIETSGSLWTYRRLYNGWLIFSNVHLSDVLSGLSRILWIIGITFSVVLLITLIITNSFAKRIAAPYSYLAKRIQAIGEGDYQLNISSGYLLRKDEAGVLSNAIAAMQNQLQENFNTIKNANENLEITVQHRTKELLETNQQLESLLVEIRETQKQLALSEKMASLSKVLVGLSHNMNTPLGNAITLVTYYESRLKEILRSLDERSLGQTELRQHLIDGVDIVKHVYENIQTSRSYIERISDISRARQTSLPEIIHLKNLVTSQYILASANDIRDNTQLHVNFDDTLTVIASPLYLSEIIYELIDNAIGHAQMPNEMLSISIEATFDERLGLLTLSVIDDGIGLKPHEYYEIFTPLVTSQLSHRAGLGLSRIYQIVKDEFSGSIIASPHAPRGTCFQIKLFCKTTLDVQ